LLKKVYGSETAEHPEKFWDDQDQEDNRKTALNEAVESVEIARKN